MTSPPPGGPAAGDRLRTLAGLAGYRCGHTGSCCRAGWPIPIEALPLELIRRADATGHIGRLALSAWESDGILCHSTEGQCVFHRPESARAGCLLETTLGSSALPFSCRQFPRLLIADADGWHQSLSAWCGTTAALLAAPATGDQSHQTSDFLSFTHIEVDPRVHVEGLDARDAWPPLLRPGVLAGHAAYRLWETRILHEVLAGMAPESAATEALAAALVWTDDMRAWRSSDGALETRLQRTALPRRRRALSKGGRPHVRTELIGRIPDQWRPLAWPEGLVDTTDEGPPIDKHHADLVLRRYLATRLFGSWMAFQGEGLRAVLVSLTSAAWLFSDALASLAGEQRPTLGHLRSALRASDWILLHLLDRDQWAAWCSTFEAAPDCRPVLEILADAQDTLDRLRWA